jgi:uroporphyrinogen decarboxylase
MVMTKRERMEHFFKNEEVDRVPVGFWHHFVSFHDHYSGMDDIIFNQVVASQKKYIDDVDPDFVKIMSDGFFGHPSVCKKLITTVDDLKDIKSVGPNDPWITKQVSYVKEICDYAGKDIYKFYNIFSPLQYIRLRFEEYDEDMEKFVRLFKENPYVMTEAARNIAEDIKCLIKRLYEETDIDGIFYSVQAVQSNDFDHNVHRELVEPLDLELLNYMNHFSTNVILHICGYGKYTNTLDWYKEYPAAVYNWAVYSENVSVAEGKRIFGGKPVLAGFDNATGTILDSGTDEDVRNHVKEILDEAGTKGVGLGADCTISADIPSSRLKFVVKAAEDYSAKH